MVKKAKSLGMTACGLTDHGTFAGAIDFLRTCREEEIRPILGMETYISKDHTAHSKEEQPNGRRGNYHLNVIAKNYTGFQNVCALSQTASLEGFYYDPRIDAELLWKHREGIIVTSACLKSTINTFLANDQYDLARNTAACYKDIFGEDFYLEMMFHGIDREAKILPEIQRLAKDVGVKILITNDTHYIRQEDAEFNEVVMCISSGKTLKDPKRLKFPYRELYFKSKDEMAEIFGDLPQAMRNTLEVAEKCDYSDIIFVEDGGTMKLPKFDIPPEFESSYDYLDDMAQKGLVNLGLHKSEQHIERLETELSDVKLIWDTKRYDFATYFLIVEDIMRFAKENGINAGVRGSGYGSLLLKCIGIVEGVIDPIKFELLWERFLGFSNFVFLTEEDFGPVAQK